MFQSTSLQSLAERNLDIPPHIDICIVRGEAELSDINAVNFIVASAEAKVAHLEAYIEGLSIADDVNESALDLVYEELKEMDPSTFEAKAAIILLVWSRLHDDDKTHQGGWHMLIALARALFVKPHLLILN